MPFKNLQTEQKCNCVTFSILKLSFRMLYHNRVDVVRTVNVQHTSRKTAFGDFLENVFSSLFKSLLLQHLEKEKYITVIKVNYCIAVTH